MNPDSGKFAIARNAIARCAWSSFSQSPDYEILKFHANYERRPNERMTIDPIYPINRGLIITRAGCKLPFLRHFSRASRAIFPPGFTRGSWNHVRETTSSVARCELQFPLSAGLQRVSLRSHYSNSTFAYLMTHCTSFVSAHVTTI